MFTVGFIGAGAVASTLAQKLSRCGYPVVAVSSLNGLSAARLAEHLPGCSVFLNNQEVVDNSEFVFIATPDDAISTVCQQMQWRQGQQVVHLSGAATTQKLEDARRSGAEVGVFHPLQSFSREGSTSLEGATFALEAEGRLLANLKNMADSLGGLWLILKPEDRALYHAAAVMACNYVTTLAKLAADLWGKFGVPPATALKALLPLIKGSVKNLENPGLPECLTGPIARGDSLTIENHLNALRQRAPEIETVYRELGLQTIPIAVAKGTLRTAQAELIKVMLIEKR